MVAVETEKCRTNNKHMKKTTMICIAFAILVAGCKKVDVDFSYSPLEPRAGQEVKFSNKSNEGESWSWNFGDNVTSMTKHPKHTFKRPGEYQVTLVVDSAKYNTCTRSITVYDTVPTFVVSTDSICHYTDVELTANVYNPFGYALVYQWSLPEGCVLTSGQLDSRRIGVYFQEYGKTASVALTITQNGKTYEPIQRELKIHQTLSPSIVMELASKYVMRQHMINGYLETPKNADGEDVRLLELYSDTSVVFNGVRFEASQMQAIFPNRSISRLQIDAMAQKWYIVCEEGLMVANFDGQHVQLIDADATGGLYVDAERNRLYWASPSGLKAMPLVKSLNNQFATTPVLYNTISDIDRIVVNPEYK